MMQKALNDFSMPNGVCRRMLLLNSVASEKDGMTR